jgi:tripartite-type tricarboxylate transporter receptor subunit TctC
VSGFFAPAATPRAVLDRLNREFNAVLAMPSVRERLSSLGMEVAGGSREDFASELARDSLHWSKLIRELGIRLE